MSRRTAIFFTVLFLLGQTELHQVLKLPVLVNHFLEHREQNPAITLVFFLTEHYHKHTMVDNDEQRDRQLPFKGNDCLSASAQVCMEEPATIDLRAPEQTLSREYNLAPRYTLPHQLSHSIFQPPKTV